MKAAAAILFFVLAAGVSAQRGTGQGRSANPTAPPAPRNYVVIGCISRQVQGQGPRFMLTDRRSDPPEVYRLDGDQNQFDLHVGHLVEVTGPLSAAPAAARGATPLAGILKATSLTWLLNTCPKK